MLASLSSFIQKVSNRKSFCILLVLYGLYFSIFFYAAVPFGLAQMKSYAGQAGILDVETYYTAAQAYQRLALLGEQGRAAYLRILMGDLIYPALLGCFLSVAITLVVRRLVSPDSAWSRLNLLPIANLAADYLENALLIILLVSYPAQLSGLATVAGVMTLVKNLFGLLSFLTLAVGLGILLYRRLAQWSGQRKSSAIRNGDEPGAKGYDSAELS